MTEAEQRAAAVAEAKRWLRTPFKHRQRLPGAGVDCIHFLVACYEAAGVVTGIEMPSYSRDWFLHASDGRLLDRVLRHTREVSNPGPGDCVLFRMPGRDRPASDYPFSHAAILIDRPRVIHARWKSGVEWDDLTLNPLARLPMAFFSPWF